jgi:hypothetical protein
LIGWFAESEAPVASLAAGRCPVLALSGHSQRKQCGRLCANFVFMGPDKIRDAPELEI